MTLAALQVQEKHGDYAGDVGPLKANMRKFVSKKFLETPAREQEMEDMVLKVWQTLSGKGYTSRDAKVNYLDYIKAWKIYGSTYFVVEPQNSRDFPKEVVLAINAQRVLIVHPQSQEFLAEYPYNEVVTWGQSSKSFVLVTGNLVRQQKVSGGFFFFSSATCFFLLFFLVFLFFVFEYRAHIMYSLRLPRTGLLPHRARERYEQSRARVRQQNHRKVKKMRAPRER